MFSRLGLLLLLPTLVLATAPCYAQQLRTTKVPEKKLPRGFDYQGRLVEALSWTDKQGPHIVAVTIQGLSRATHDDDDGRRSIVYLHNYLTQADSLGKGWQYQLISSLRCTPDQQIPVLQHTLRVTDMNRDGIAEIWLVYYRNCMMGRQTQPQLLMFENGNSYRAVNGRKSLFFDEVFLAGPQEFRTYAQFLWDALPVVAPAEP